ncbi:UPF0480 like protein [Termitomyces sp. T112]|nr:UPF0480 like protein [Termitomyces sp. T112]KAH0590522.1 hypothetical protein H2248_000669 [Termitomyces sp. 'cryptogamus']
MVLILVFLAISCLASFATALDLTGKIQWNDECPDIHALRPSKVILDNGKLKGSILRDGSFTIPEVPVGTYVLSVVTPDYSFDQLRIDVVDLESEPLVRPYIIGTPLNPPSTVLLTYPIILTPKSKHAYFVPRESFNLVAMLSNPMTLMMVVGGAMMLAMPYLMKNMDPEAMEEFKEQHAKVASFQNAVASGDIKTGFSAIMGGEESKAGPATHPTSTSTKSRGNRNKRR